MEQQPGGSGFRPGRQGPGNGPGQKKRDGPDFGFPGIGDRKRDRARNLPQLEGEGDPKGHRLPGRRKDVSLPMLRKNHDETDRVHNSAFSGDTVGAVPLLGDPVVESHDWAGEVEWRVHCVSEIVAERKVRGFGRNSDAVALGQIRGIELFLLWLLLA